VALPKILRDLLALPTVAFVEDAVLDYLCRACQSLAGVSCRTDRFGNLLVRYRHRPRAGTPLAFSAHVDHPGFVAQRMVSRRTLRASFRGGVAAEYFRGAKVRFFSGGRWVRGRVRRVARVREVYRLVGTMRLPEETLVDVEHPVERNSPGMWDLPEPALRGDIVTARGCDDVAGAAALLALLQRLSRRRSRAEVYCLFSRAEEVGFIGAIAACKAGTIPRRVPIISIETSSDRGGGATVGDGPILRVGDRASTFDPALTGFCQAVAERLARRRRTFRYQRKLMAGGTCESTAFMAYGYASTGICLALGNYHNMDVRRRRIASERISLSDWKRMVDWFEALVTDRDGYRPGGTDLRREMERRFNRWRKELRRCAAHGGR